MHKTALSMTFSRCRQVIALALLGAGLVLTQGETVISYVKEHRSPMTLNHARTWCYQLFAIDLQAMRAADCDMLVIDPADDTRAYYSKKSLSAVKTNPDGRRRAVLAYLNIGEAEMYRPYWNRSWLRDAPPWLIGRNEAWRGNFKVRYWAPEWHQIVYGGAGSLLTAILGAGFDGVYLDNLDSYIESLTENRQARREMVMLVGSVAREARLKHKQFRIVAQNAEELLSDDEYLQAIDGVAKEDLLFGIHGDGVRNDQSDILHSIHYLNIAQRSHKPVFVVEYIEGPAIEPARRELAELGFVPLFAERLLDRILPMRFRSPAESNP